MNLHKKDYLLDWKSGSLFRLMLGKLRAVRSCSFSPIRSVTADTVQGQKSMRTYSTVTSLKPSSMTLLLWLSQYFSYNFLFSQCPLGSTCFLPRFWGMKIRLLFLSHSTFLKRRFTSTTSSQRYSSKWRVEPDCRHTLQST